MRAVPEFRSQVALFALVIFLPWVNASPADAPLRRALTTPAATRPSLPAMVSRPVSRDDIFAAIQEYLQRNGMPMRGGLRPGDLKIQSAVPMTSGDAGLAVRRISYDPLRGATVFQLWSSQEPRHLPFVVTTRRELPSWGQPSPPGENSRDATKNPDGGDHALRPGVSAARPKPPVLVRPGQPATLVILGQNLRITTTVVPLQPGIKGQCILVRDVVSAQVMKAEVVDAGWLQAGL